MKRVFILSTLFLGSTLLASKSVHNMHRDFCYKRPDMANGPIGNISIVIDKSDYELSIYDEKGWFATYPVVFGNSTLSDKKMQGDKNTPEGSFHITAKRIHEKWCRFMSLDYPTKDSYDRFNVRKKKGEIPANANIGGGIGIHGTWPHEDFVIDHYTNWTEGCISMKNMDVSEIYNYVKASTNVTIKK